MFIRVFKVLAKFLIGVLILAVLVQIIATVFFGVPPVMILISFAVLIVVIGKAIAGFFTFTTDFQGAIPRSEVLVSRASIFSLDACDSLEIVRLPENAPPVPFGTDQTNWVMVNRHLYPKDPIGLWTTTPGHVDIKLFECNLPQNVLDALLRAQSQPGSWVLNVHHTYSEAWLYSAPERIALRASWGD